jgi:hypothetical protein
MNALVANADNLEELFAALEELLKRIADTDDPVIRRKRALVRADMIAIQKTPAIANFHSLELGSLSKDRPTEGWGRQAWAAVAGAAVALSVLRHSS